MDTSSFVAILVGIIVGVTLFYYLGKLLGRHWYLAGMLSVLPFAVGVLLLLQGSEASMCSSTNKYSTCAISQGISLWFGVVLIIFSLVLGLFGLFVAKLGSKKKSGVVD